MTLLPRILFWNELTLAQKNHNSYYNSGFLKNTHTHTLCDAWTQIVDFFQPYSEKMKNTTDEDKKNMYIRIIVSVLLWWKLRVN